MDQKKYRDEHLLVEQLKEGCQEAYGYLFGIYHRELCNYMTVVSGSTRVAEDIAQQTFIRLWDNRERLVVQENKLKHYIFKIAYHLFIDSKRKKKKEFELLESLKQEAYLEVADADASLFEERLKRVETEIENLPEQCKRVFIMSKKEGLKYQEISERLHISIKTVEVHIGKALKRLRAQLTIFF
ncbi:RNA polymerase sigma-70 factor [Flagellimonas alvinocaridis]|uniref:RNA polymerase sigma-70 factor n=1 Tax=Flagellimonas alvinocaridis TaxID=2530200 RepID=A0A4S8RLV0_9FLAO|nr:RNA polymerase sigma-70 factor [Allomuricauda alvinocaridis]THV59477.1 RNA polymerase sigma-70 factor [Allomuricauda alvinocaridis]